MVYKYCIGDVVELRKQHPCGSKQWEVTRIGADFKIKCLGCDHLVMLPRTKFEKSVKKIIKACGTIDGEPEA
ncbi:MAG: DUF951 domain-containing protein [Clostridiaceae bacterium]|nr:DUF951 domain-containing protein [Clostridiaceae bacterium]